ncbi:MAG: inositol-3-phosphate synthase [Betaproteobacteria bacterium]|nr:inositol-3-phosphate synthase [Betaproteobacteria bacterium]
MPRIAIAGVGNCASALLQALSAAYKDALQGEMRERIGPWRSADIEVVAAFDIDRRKVGRPLGEAAFAPPNCVKTFEPDLSMFTVPVQMGPVLDGVAPHMREFPDERTFLAADLPPVDVAAALRASGAEVLVCYLPVGSEQAVRHYAQACLEAGAGLVNCVPVFIASDPEWAARFAAAGLPLIGDDIKSQLGATILHRTLAWLFDMRGIRIDHTYQLNTGGNTDFLNMLARDRLESKKISKTGSVQSALLDSLPAEDVHIGPSDYVPWQKDNKVCFLRIEGRGLGDAPVELEIRLSVQDSPNSAGVVLDAIRCARLALDRGLGGALIEPSAAFMKTPPRQFHDLEAQRLCDAFIAGDDA